MTTDAAYAANDDSARGPALTPPVEQFNESASQQIGKLVPIIAEPATSAKQNPGQRGTTVPATVRPVPTIEHVIAAPIDQLLDQQDAMLVELDRPMDSWFFGQLVHKRDGQIILAMPPGRSAIEQDASVRMLIAQFHGLTSDDFPSHMTTTNVIENGEYVL
ncbi:hypothetical protein Q5762_13965 [Streptomyces sp. P9(2023)]|uniref:hypothetical protein n=1 Tax=Streptomyces sp. P9(2023) TaxID=3064394 RepID=UPI0028F40FE4|nr:hypothetical protein [Streptomyces sp. P9(2023)]MDT9689423.1 hypothetical protein [Streptomyces sp. P9(2023)]